MDNKTSTLTVGCWYFHIRSYPYFTTDSEDIFSVHFLGFYYFLGQLLLVPLVISASNEEHPQNNMFLTRKVKNILLI